MCAVLIEAPPTSRGQNAGSHGRFVERGVIKSIAWLEVHLWLHVQHRQLGHHLIFDAVHHHLLQVTPAAAVHEEAVHQHAVLHMHTATQQHHRNAE